MHLLPLCNRDVSTVFAKMQDKITCSLNKQSNVSNSPNTYTPSDLPICSSLNVLGMHYVGRFKTVIGYRDKPANIKD
jgi:hypothetical protein